MTPTRERLLRRRLLLLRWAAETRDEAQRLASDLDPTSTDLKRPWVGSDLRPRLQVAKAPRLGPETAACRPSQTRRADHCMGTSDCVG